MKYQTKDEAMQHLSAKPAVAKKQADMIDCMYGIGEQVSQNDLDGIDMDCHQAAMKKAMSY
jgi:hypothetical protein